MLSNTLIAPVLLVVVLLAVLAPVHMLLYVDLATVMLPGQWEPAGIMIGPSDFVIAGLLLAAFLRIRSSRPLPRRPLMMWGLTVFVIAVSYLSAPIHQLHFDGPLEVGYQLLRYVLKELLYLPLVLLLFRSEERLKQLSLALVVVGSMIALHACIQGYAGESARGPFEGKNMIGGALVVPLLFSLYWFLRSRSVFRLAFFGGCAILIARAMLFVGSRGAYVSLLAGLAVLTVAIFRHANTRNRALRLVPVALGLVVVVIIAKPHILNRGSIQAFLSITEGVEESNMRWRIQERWPHFWAMALEHPWLGIGTHTDESLGWEANTPHSGYLAAAVEFGFPAAFLILGLGIGAIGRSRRLFYRLEGDDMQMLSAYVGGSLVAIFVHLVVEATVFQQAFMMNVYLMLIGMSLAMEDLYREASERDEGRQDGAVVKRELDSKDSRQGLQERPAVRQPAARVVDA